MEDSGRVMQATLQEHCAELRKSLLARRAATVEEIQDFWPLGKQNTGDGLWAWIRCYANYVAFGRRQDPTAKAAARQARQQALLEAMADRPKLVELTERDAEGLPLTVTVHAKSYVALTEVHVRQVLIAHLADGARVLEEAGRAEDLEFIVRSYREQQYLQRVIVWIATHEGPGLPFPEQAPRPEPPEVLARLAPSDLYAIAQAFQEVNVLRLAALEQTHASETQPDWTVFFASVAGDHGSTTRLMRDQSLTSVVASTAERARGQAEARARAEKARATPTPGMQQRRAG